MSQISDLNDRLTRAPAVTAAALGLAGTTLTTVRGTAGLPGSAVLTRLSGDGPPEWPYIHGYFACGSAGGQTCTIELHTAALRRLSSAVHAHHLWGVGTAGSAQAPEPIRRYPS